MVHNTRRSFNCECGKKYTTEITYERHIKECFNWKKSSKEGIDYVECKICGRIGRSLAAHISREHGLKKEDYEKAHGPTICKVSQQKYYDTRNFDWIKREKEKGNDLKEWRENLGKIISKRILSSEAEREVRRQNLTKQNKSKRGRKVSSDTAKKTSARKDIQAKRAKVLKEWRENNPEVFYKKCIKKFVNSWNSKPEGMLYEVINNQFKCFKRNHQLKRINNFKSTKSGKRQIDIISMEEKIIIEYDGIFHFKEVFKTQKYSLKDTIFKDNELNTVMVAEGWTVIRVAYDQFSYSGGFNQECLDKVFDIIENKKRGLFLLGDSYNDKI